MTQSPRTVSRMISRLVLAPIEYTASVAFWFNQARWQLVNFAFDQSLGTNAEVGSRDSRTNQEGKMPHT